MSNATDILGRLAHKLDPDLLALLNELLAGNTDRDQAIRALTAATVTATTVTAGNLAGAFAGAATINQLAFPSQDITTTGTAISSTVTHVQLDKSDGVLASTLAAPSTGRLLIITQVDAGTSGHTVTLSSGTWDGTNPIATFNAKGETLVVLGLNAARFLVLVNLGSVAFSGG